jgi:hypothetical protein
MRRAQVGRVERKAFLLGRIEVASGGNGHHMIDRGRPARARRGVEVEGASAQPAHAGRGENLGSHPLPIRARTTGMPANSVEIHRISPNVCESALFPSQRNQMTERVLTCPRLKADPAGTPPDLGLYR